MGTPYPPGDPQISPRSIEEYAALQQQAQANPQGHLLHRGQQPPPQHPGHPGHPAASVAHMHGYGSRNRAAAAAVAAVAGEMPVPQGSPHAGANSNPYRKDMDYYFSMGGGARDRSRRGSMGFGASFGYSNMDGHVPHQYRHAMGTGSASGMMSPYPLDYGSATASGGNSSGAGGTGSFSPSQQYSMAQGPGSMQQPMSASPMHQRQQSQKYPAHQALLQGQPHRSYPLHSHRVPPHFSHYPTGSAGLYNSPPQRYDSGSTATVDVKVNSSPTHSNPAPSNSIGQPESVGQPYPASQPPYSPQSHSLHKQGSHGQRNSQPSLATGYEASVKMQPHAGLAAHAYPKPSQSSASLASPAMPHPASQEVSKSPMSSQSQPSQMQQNFSPVSNPSPAASAVQSPSCSSSSSPLMGVSDSTGNAPASQAHPPSQSSLSNPRGSHGHGRLLQTMPQLSPTAHSNSSISSCGSSVAGKGVHPAAAPGRPGVGSKGVAAGGREDSQASIYPSCPQPKMMQDPGLNSLNALTSQVANIPNTVQHMLLTDTLLSHKKGKDGPPHSHMQPSPHSKSQSGCASALGHGHLRDEAEVMASEDSNSDRTVVEDLSSRPDRTIEAKEEQMGHFTDNEPKRMRQMSGTSNESEPSSYYPTSKGHGNHASQPQNQKTGEQTCRKMPLRVETEPLKKLQISYSTVSGAHNRTPDIQTPLSSSPHSIPPSAQPSPNIPHCRPPSSMTSSSTPSPAPSSLSNCYMESDAINADSKNGVKERASTEIKMEKNTKTEIDESQKKWDNPIHRGHQVGLHESEGIKKMQTMDSCKEEMLSPKQNESKDGRSDKALSLVDDGSVNAVEPQHGGVCVIVSTRPDCNQPEMAKPFEHVPISSQYGGSPHASQQSYPDDRKFLRDSRHHNGDGEAPADQYPGPYDTSPKTDFGQMAPHLGPYKYGNHEMAYNTCLGMRNRGRMGSGAAGMSTSPRYQGYSQPPSSYSSLPHKNSGIMNLDAQVRRTMGMGPRPEDSTSQMQQQYPSLLQEVLQGYHLDRRYGRPEQAAAHLQPPTMSQHHYQSRHPYGLIEGMKHGVGATSFMGGTTAHLAEMAAGKPHPLNQMQGAGNDMGPMSSHSSWDPEMQRLKALHCTPPEKSGVGVSPNQASHMQQPTDLSTGPQAKHINLADYSLPQRKSSNLTSSPSAVQQLLLQEVEPLSGSVTPTSQTQATALLSPLSERRSVICDVSPSRRSPDQDMNPPLMQAASDIQPPFSASELREDNRKVQLSDKAMVKIEEPAMATESANQNVEDLSANSAKKKLKCPMPPSDIQSKQHRTDGSSIDTSTPTSHHHPQHPPHHPIQNSLMSPQTQQTFPQGIDVSSSHASPYSGYLYGEGNAELTKVPKPSYHGYGAGPSQSQLSNKSDGFTSPISIHRGQDVEARLDWTATPNRPTDVLIPNSAPDLHTPQNQPERNLLSPTDSLTNSSQLPRQQSQYLGPYYDMKMWESYTGREPGIGVHETDAPKKGQSAAVAVPSETLSGPPSATSTLPAETESSQLLMEETGKPSLHPLPTSNSVNNSTSHPSGAAGNQGAPQGRQFRTGGSGEPNPLMLRRRVRSFISPIPAKRLHQEGAQKAGVASYQTDPRCPSENDTDTARHRLSSPTSCTTPTSLSPSSQGKMKVLPARKGRGLKLEAIVQKITPNTKKSADYNSMGDSDSNYAETEGPPYCAEDQDASVRFSSGDSSCLPYLGEDEVLTYRGLDDPGPSSMIVYDSIKESSTGSSIGGALRGLQSDFDFGLGTSAAAGSLVGDSEKDDLRMGSDFALLGPLPPPPPLPRPVQGSPPPSSSALSDIQQFTNTYQQLETRRGEQSAANLLRQKLQESGMGFDDYSSSDYFGASLAHGQGHHLLSRPPHQATSPRSGMSASDTKPPDSIVPKGYFPSGKKKGRPVGSVNKQKRAQQQNQQQVTSMGSNTSAQSLSPVATPTAVPQVALTVATKAEAPPSMTSPEILTPAVSTPPTEAATLKDDAEVEEMQIDINAKTVRHRPRKGKEGSEDGGTSSRQKKRRRAVPVTSKEEPDTTNTAVNTIGVFSPFIHVENKIAEIGAVCSIVNGEEEKVKTGKNGGATDTLASLAQMVKRDKEMVRSRENRMAAQVESTHQSEKALPSSGFVLPGPVISEGPHSGRMLCCLCQKWANYKHLGDLYGPYYPSEYASKLPKNQPQVKQMPSLPGSSTAGVSLMSHSVDLTSTDTHLLDSSHVKSSTDSDCTASHVTNPTSPATTVGTASPLAGEEVPPFLYKTASAAINRRVHNWELTQESSTSTESQKPPELQREILTELKPQSQQQVEDTQQWPQHRKLTSHPRFKRRHKSGEDLPRTIPSNNKASLPFQPPPPSLDSLGPLAQLAQLPQVPLDPEELWVHEGCITWASGVFLVNGKLYGLEETLEGAKETNCSHCEMAGATLGCHSKGCTLRYHYICGIEADCSMNEENFSLRCPKHKFSQSSRPAKSIYLEQSERG